MLNIKILDTYNAISKPLYQAYSQLIWETYISFEQTWILFPRESILPSFLKMGQVAKGFWRRWKVYDNKNRQWQNFDPKSLFESANFKMAELKTARDPRDWYYSWDR